MSKRKRKTKTNAKNTTNKKTGKKTAKKSRKIVSRNIKGKYKKRKGTVSKPSQIRKQKPARKIPIKNKRNLQGQKRKHKSHGTTRKRISKAWIEPGILRVNKERGKSVYNYTFEKVRKVDKKISLFSAAAGKSIKSELSKRGGKPPKGIVVTVRDSKGREHTKISNFDFVVNPENVKSFVDNMLTIMKDDFEAWADGEPDPENPYADYNPDSIKEVSIKYIL